VVGDSVGSVFIVLWESEGGVVGMRVRGREKNILDWRGGAV